MTGARPYVLAAGLAGQVAAVTVGVLPLLALPLTAVALVVLTRFELAWLRVAATVVALGVVAACLPSLVSPHSLVDHKGTLGLLLVVAQLAQAAGWRTIRDERGGLLTALGLMVLAASYSPDVLVGAPILLGWVAALLALAHLSGVRGPQLLTAAAVSTVFGLVAFLLVPLPRTAGLHSRLAGGSGQAAPAGRASLGDAVYSGSHLDLDLRGPLSTAPVLSVPNDSPSLWRSAVYDTYDGGGWSRPDATDGSDGTFFEVSQATGPTTAFTATPAGSGGGDVYAPGQLVSMTTGQTVHVERGFEGSLGSYLIAPYTVTVQPEVTDPTQLVSTQGEDVADRRWRGLPSTLPQRVRTLAQQLAAGQTSRWQVAQAITTYLHAHEKYTLSSPVPKPGQDAVDRFLFVDHLGFCEQFASAEVVLLRANGIPSRLVTGLAYGTAHGATRSYLGKDLHAWVELWVPGAGWVTSDPTAGTVLSDATGAGLRSRVATAVTTFLRRLTHVPGGRPVLALALLAAAAVVVLIGRRRVARRPVAPTAAPQAPPGPALAAFLRLDQRLGPEGRAEAESLRELGSRLPAEVAEALVVVEQEVYGPGQPEVAAAVEVLDRAAP